MKEGIGSRNEFYFPSEHWFHALQFSGPPGSHWFLTCGFTRKKEGNLHLKNSDSIDVCLMGLGKDISVFILYSALNSHTNSVALDDFRFLVP